LHTVISVFVGLGYIYAQLLPCL